MKRSFRHCLSALMSTVTLVLGISFVSCGRTVSSLVEVLIISPRQPADVRDRFQEDASVPKHTYRATDEVDLDSVDISSPYQIQSIVDSNSTLNIARLYQRLGISSEITGVGGSTFFAKCDYCRADI